MGCFTLNVSMFSRTCLCVCLLSKDYLSYNVASGIVGEPEIKKLEKSGRKVAEF